MNVICAFILGPDSMVTNRYSCGDKGVYSKQGQTAKYCTYINLGYIATPKHRG
jgi:hypothetical protein